MYGYNQNAYYPQYQTQYNQQVQPQSYMQQYQQQQGQQFVKGRPVSSLEEAKASMIDLDGSLFVFPDIKNNAIYTKQIMLDGSAEFKTYQLIQEPKQVQQLTDDYVLMKDFQSVVRELNNKIESIMKGAMNNGYEESTANGTNGKQK